MASEQKPTANTDKSQSTLPVLLFLLVRFALLVSLPLEGLRGYGDFVNYFNLAGLGRPFIDIWVEYPPIFPFVSAVLHRLSGGRQHVFDYLLVLTLTLAQAGSLWLFLKLARRLHGEVESNQRGWVYFATLVGLAYGWWYFDPLAVFAMLLSLHWLLEKRVFSAGVTLALGMLIKWFPGLAIVVAWRTLSLRQALWTTILAAGIVASVFAGLYLISPEFTTASLRSQASKGSWETVWALIDNNLTTGLFGPLSERQFPELAARPVGNPPRISLWATLPVFAGIGLYLYWRSRSAGTRRVDALGEIAFLGLTWCSFLVWLPGYSPQWVLYLLPIILLVLPQPEALAASMVLILVNLLEWPILLSRGQFMGLWLTVPLRTGLLALFGARFWLIVLKNASPKAN